MTDEKPPSDEFVRELTRVLGARGASGVDAGPWRADGMWARFVERWRREEKRLDARMPSGGATPSKEGSFLSTDPAALRERSAGRGVRVGRNSGTSMLRRRLGSLGLLAGMVCLVFVMRWVILGERSETLGVTRTYQTATGQRATLTLNDGTRVSMGPRTMLRLVQFGQRMRTVELHGEVYFDVVNAHGAPFVVRTGSTVTRVLGTTFVVRHYPGDPTVRVTVMTGKVNISAKNPNQPTITVTSGNIGEVGDSIAVVHTADDQNAEVWWTRDELVFNHALVTEVLATLTHWYGYTFTSTDSSLMRQDVTVALSTQSSARALAALEQVLNVSLSIKGDTITLIPRRSGETRRIPRAKAYDVWTPSGEVGR